MFPFQVVDLELTRIMDAGDFPVVLHGTYMKNWQSIKKQARVIMISVNKFGERKIIFFPCSVSMEMAAILNFIAPAKVHITLTRLVQMLDMYTRILTYR